jgi:outer membrane immunogenic protein
LPFPLDEGCHTATGGILGGQLGYNFQTGPVVFGLEAQVDWASLRGSGLSLLPFPPFPPSTNETHITGLGLFTGRIGYAWGPALVYLKGGAAVVRDEYDFFFNGPPPSAAVSASATRWGGTIGGGLEYKFVQNWSVALEYDYADFGTTRLTFVSVPVSSVEDIRQKLNLLTARLNYAF